MKKVIFVVVVLCLATGSIFAFNYFSVGKPIVEVLDADPRNSGIEISSNYKNYIQLSTLAVNVRRVEGEKSAADVFRVLLQYSSKIKDKKFDLILLQSKGKTKFQLKGDYFRQLGIEYGQQNPVYTMRTFTEHLYTSEGDKAFGTWTGGLLGVLKEQMEDFEEFHKKWYVEDM